MHTAAQNRTDLYPDSKDPGLDATIDAIQGVTNLKINYYVMVNLNGFKGLVNAVGGVTMDVKTRIAMFGHDDAWKNTLHRARQAEAQRPAGALVRPQPRAVRRLHPHGPAEVPDGRDGRPAQPAEGAANATKIAKSGKELLSTNIPAKELGQFADLALKSRGEKIRTVSVVPPEFNTVTPDFPAIQAAIQKAIDKSESTVTPTKKPKDRLGPRRQPDRRPRQPSAKPRLVVT